MLYALWTSSYVASNGDVMRKLAAQFLSLAEKQAATAALLTAHRIMGITLTYVGDIRHGRAHFDKGIALYDHAEHLPLATRFGVDARVSILSNRSWALWFLGYPDDALADADHAIADARVIGQTATLIYALWHAATTYFQCGIYVRVVAAADELAVLVDETGSLFWKPIGMLHRGLALAATGKASEAVHTITSAMTAYRSTGAVMMSPLYLSHLARAHAEISQLHDAWRRISEAIDAVESCRERWWEVDVRRMAGEIALKSPEQDAAKAEAYFERALAVAREQQAKSWELRAAMSMARLWRDQGKRQQAHDLLAPVYGWFTEGFDTLDLKEAKTLFDELAQ